MSNVLVIVEQREGKLNRVSFETLRGAQQLAAEMGWTLEAAVLGANVPLGSLDGIANEIAKTKVAKVYALSCAACEHYTPDAYAGALKQFVESKKPTLVLMPHTY